MSYAHLSNTLYHSC